MSKEELLNYFSKFMLYGNWKRLGVTFKTQNAKYFYDAGTTNVFECEDKEFSVVDNILQHSGLAYLEETG